MAERKRFYIVVAEDNHADVILIQEALELHRVHCEMDVSSDGAEAIRYFLALDINFRSPAPDVVLLDMHLPKYDGEEMLKALRSTQRTAETPVIIMTGGSIAEVEKVMQKDAALHYFRKSSSWEEFAQLGAIVQNLLELRKLSHSETNPTGSTDRVGA